MRNPAVGERGRRRSAAMEGRGLPTIGPRLSRALRLLGGLQELPGPVLSHQFRLLRHTIPTLGGAVRLVDLIPDADAVLALEPDELGLRLLPILADWNIHHRSVQLSLDNTP